MLKQLNASLESLASLVQMVILCKNTNCTSINLSSLPMTSLPKMLNSPKLAVEQLVNFTKLAKLNLCDYYFLIFHTCAILLELAKLTHKQPMLINNCRMKTFATSYLKLGKYKFELIQCKKSYQLRMLTFQSNPNYFNNLYPSNIT